MRRTMLLLTLALAIMPASHAQQQRTEMGRYTSAFSSASGQQVWVTRYGPKEQQEALVQIVGIDHPLDGKVLRANMQPGDQDRMTKYFTTVNGAKIEVLRLRGERGTLLLTGVPFTTDLSYDKTLVSERPPQHMLTDFLGAAQKK